MTQLVSDKYEGTFQDTNKVKVLQGGLQSLVGQQETFSTFTPSLPICPSHVGYPQNQLDGWKVR